MIRRGFVLANARSEIARDGSDDEDNDSYEALYRRYVPSGYKMVAGAIVPDDAP